MLGTVRMSGNNVTTDEDHDGEPAADDCDPILEETPHSPGEGPLISSTEAAPEVTKATVSQALGTIIYPITREIASWEERGIQGIKDAIRAKRQRKLADAASIDLAGIREKIQSDERAATSVARLLDAFEEAGAHDMDDDSLLALWSRLIARIRQGDRDTEMLQEKLSQLSPGEAHLLLEVAAGKRIRYGVHPLIAAISVRSTGRYYEKQREQQVAQSLRKKGLIEQPLPVRAMVMMLAAFSPILLVAAYPQSYLSEALSLFIWPTFIVLFVMSMAMASVVHPPVRPTWIGAKLVAEVESSNSPRYG